MSFPMHLDADAAAWVEATLASMSTDECLGHLLCSEDRGYTPQQWEELLRQVPLGSIFFGPGRSEEVRAKIAAAQAASRIPLLAASDFEFGAGNMLADETFFPSMMALGATDDPALAEAMGRATAREARAVGFNWTFSPVADLLYNRENPVTGVRSLGDDPERVLRLLVPLIRGMQADGLLGATAKHFPGDGIDDRDQHLCTSVNSLDTGTWRRTYGRVWRACIHQAQTMAVMPGHLSLPHYQGQAAAPHLGLPATLDPLLLDNLLRRELGFDGVIVSDAAPMIGITSRRPAAELAERFVLAGGDVWLFANPVEDFHRLQAALHAGRLSEERVRASARRVLAMKARLGLHRPGSLCAPPVDDALRQRHQATATAIAEASLVLERSGLNTPVHLPPGAKVLCVTVRGEGEAKPPLRCDLPEVAEELRRRGFQVETRVNPGHDFLAREAPAYAAVFVNLQIAPHQRIGTYRMVGDPIFQFWRAFYADHPCVVFTSFGSPNILYEMPAIPNLWQAFGHAPASQRAAVRAWLGEIVPRGRMPLRDRRLCVDPATLGL